MDTDGLALSKVYDAYTFNPLVEGCTDLYMLACLAHVASLYNIITKCTYLLIRCRGNLFALFLE